MDGTSLIEIAKNKQISAITINRSIKRIYWLLDFNIIETTDYDGIDHFIVYKSNHFTDRIMSLVFHKDQLFWLYADSEFEQTKVYSCHTDGINCYDLVKHSVPISIQTMRVAPELINASKENPCATNNGDCQQLCLLTPNGHSCACKVGWQLDVNAKTCNPVIKFLLYCQDKHFKGRILDTTRQTFVNVFSPTRFSVLSLDYKNSIDFDRGWAFDEVYFSDDLCIYRLNLTDGKQTKVYHIPYFKNYHIQGLLVDRRSHNFYYCKKSNGFGDESILIMTIKGGQILEKTLTSFKNGGISQIPRRSLALHLKFLFYAVKTPNNIKRISLQDYNVINFGDWNSYESGSIFAIDQYDNTIYFIYLIYPDRLITRFLRVDDNHSTYVRVNIIVKNVTTFYIYQNWMYIGDDAKIWRFDKKTGEDVISVVSSPKWNSDHKIYGGQVSDLNLLNDEKKKSECAIDNGGCEQFCFDIGKISCAYRDGIIKN